MADLAAWYAPGSLDDFEQGDIFPNATIPYTAAVNLAKVQPIPTRLGAFVVLTQSCDIPKAETILLAEVMPYLRLRKEQRSPWASSKFLKVLLRNRVEHFMLIPPYDETPTGWGVVSFRNLHVVSRQVLTELATAQVPVRMRSPYSELLGECFARSIMRIAVPEPLDEFLDVEWPS